jgi:dihydroorotate dehydrogenase (NAD+) catalytic subunit
MSEFSARQDLDFRSPWLNAAGSLGYSPPDTWAWSEPMGAFVTNPVSLFPRTPAEERAAIPFPGGFLLHSGLPNPGLKGLLAGARVWERSTVPLWVHIIGDTPQEIERMVRVLESQETVSAIELGIAPLAEPEQALKLARAAVGELPLVVNFPLTAAAESWVEKLSGLGASAVSLGAPRGLLPASGSIPSSGIPGSTGKLIGGRLYGPAIFPLAMTAVRALRRQPLPVIAGGGVYRKADGEALLAAGAVAVQLDSVLWL